MHDDIRKLEQEIMEKTAELNALRKHSPGTPIKDYSFQTLQGNLRLSEMFGDHEHLLMIHNMGQACRYCTLWADGFNGVLPHLESAMAVMLVSKDSPETQRELANARGWRFQMASHGGGDYMREQSISDDGGNEPGAVVYRRQGDQLLRINRCMFGPNDLYSPIWQFLGMASLGVADWTPQYRYWSPPAKLDDGGENRAD